MVPFRIEPRQCLPAETQPISIGQSHDRSSGHAGTTSTQPAISRELDSLLSGHDEPHSPEASSVTTKRPMSPPDLPQWVPLDSLTGEASIRARPVEASGDKIQDLPEATR